MQLLQQPASHAAPPLGLGPGDVEEAPDRCHAYALHKANVTSSLASLIASLPGVHQFKQPHHGSQQFAGLMTERPPFVQLQQVAPILLSCSRHDGNQCRAMQEKVWPEYNLSPEGGHALDRHVICIDRQLSYAYYLSSVWQCQQLKAFPS